MAPPRQSVDSRPHHKSNMLVNIQMLQDEEAICVHCNRGRVIYMYTGMSGKNLQGLLISSQCRGWQENIRWSSTVREENSSVWSSQTGKLYSRWVLKGYTTLCHVPGEQCVAAQHSGIEPQRLITAREWGGFGGTTVNAPNWLPIRKGFWKYGMFKHDLKISYDLWICEKC